jgi:hypothetical protein
MRWVRVVDDGLNLLCYCPQIFFLWADIDIKFTTDLVVVLLSWRN